MASPLVLTLAFHPSPIGEMMLVADGEGCLRSLDFTDHRWRLEQLLDRHYGQGGWRLVEGPLPDIAAALDRYFAGDLSALDAIPTACNGTEFQRAAWGELRRIPAGETISYGEQARRLGRPKAMRAVGLANGCNPIGVVVPCHRVIGSGGALTGYGGGIERKRWLLDHERSHAALA